MTTPTEQPEALRLADLLQDETGVDGYVHDQAAVELRRLHAAREADREAMRMALESLRDGRNALHELANRYHDEMRFHYPDVHASMDADVARADSAIKALEQRVGES